ncbi:MAG: hypothetical protein Q4D98_00375 [Planctomycetia bacterium]|nr:hypothetical protein [Planctomycetia bacterium]
MRCRVLLVGCMSLCLMVVAGCHKVPKVLPGMLYRQLQEEESTTKGFHEAKPKSILNPSPEELARRQHFADAAAETEAEAAKLRKQWEAEDLTSGVNAARTDQQQQTTSETTLETTDAKELPTD